MNFATATLRPKARAAGLSMGLLAKLLGVSVTQVSQWERGLEAMPADVFKRWLSHVGVTDRITAGLLAAAHEMASRSPVSATRCICPFGVLRGDCPEHGDLVPP
jgi:transcriptional regulator with XRE-family HTH domain